MKTLAMPSPAAFGLRKALARLPLALALAAVLVLLAPSPALAQYQWTDENGRMVYSDVPPAPGIRVSNLVRWGDKGQAGAPAGAASASAPAEGTPAGSPQASAGDTVAGAANTPDKVATAAPAGRREPSLADRDMAFRKRQAERAEAEQKQLAQAETDRKKAGACDDARSNLRSLESGQRVSRTNAAGEREFVGDAERENRIRELRSDLASRC